MDSLVDAAPTSRRLHVVKMMFTAVMLTAVLIPNHESAGQSGGTSSTTVSIEAGNPLATFSDGWGTSLCWWANQFGDGPQADTLAEIFFTTRRVNWQGQNLPGLGLSVIRYNVGGSGGGATIDSGTVEQVSPNMPPYKTMFGYWLNWYDDDPGSDSWDWWVDSNQRNMMWRARKHGVRSIEFFSNSPMWWMCYNHSTAGSDNGDDNLQWWNWDQHATYLATVAAYAQSNWGVKVDYVEPFNEPSAWWWAYPSDQEGCHFDPGTQDYVANSLAQRLPSGVGVSVSDENDMDTALWSWNQLSQNTQNEVAKIGVHGYSGQSPYRGAGRAPLQQAAAAAGKKLWMSEYGDSDSSGLTMASSIMLDLNQLRPAAWVYWQTLDLGGWGLINSTPATNWIGQASRKYFVFAQFSRHIRPGDTLLTNTQLPAANTNSALSTVVSYNAVADKLVIVTVNTGSAQFVQYELGPNFTPTGLSTWATTTSPGSGTPDLLYQPIQAARLLSNSQVRAYHYANSVTTIEISGSYGH
jgi:galactan endo-1,6-beta-galactosidase